MSDADARLRSLFLADRPPANDPAFRLAVLERRSFRAFRDRMLLLCASGSAAIAGLVAIARVLPDPTRVILVGDIWPGICLAVAILSTTWGLSQLRRPI